MTAAAVALVAGVVGLSAVLAVQTRAKADLAESLKRETNANAELTRSQAAVQARYDLAVEAIKTFHTGVSEDFLLKQEQFKDVRDRLLKSASDFYGKLGALLGKESDLASRRALWQANYEVAELTGKVGKPEDALAAHRQVLAAREALAAEDPADPEIKADVGRSLTAVAGLLEATGRTEEAEVTYRKAETLLVELAPTIAEAAAARAVLANCRSRLGWLLHSHGPQRRSPVGLPPGACGPGGAGRRPRGDGRVPAGPGVTITRVAILLAATGKPSEAEAEYRKALAIDRSWPTTTPPSLEFRSDLAISHNNLGSLLSGTGKSSEAEAEYRKALAIRQKLADDNPAVTDFRSDLAQSRDNLGMLLSGTGKSSEAEAEYRKALAILQKLADDNPAVTEVPQPPGVQPQPTSASLLDEYGQVIGSGGRVPQGAGDPAEAGRRQPRHSQISERIWRKPARTSVGSSRRPEKRTRRSITTRGKRQSGRSSPRPARQLPKTGIAWRTARPTRRTCSVGRGGLTRRSPHASAPWRCVSLWSRRIPRFPRLPRGPRRDVPATRAGATAT